jgi:hypothetical protein
MVATCWKRNSGEEPHCTGDFFGGADDNMLNAMQFPSSGNCSVIILKRRRLSKMLRISPNLF